MINGAWLWHSMEQTNYTNWDSGYPKRVRSGIPKRHRLFRRHPMSYFVPSTEWQSLATSVYDIHQRSARSLPKNQGQRTGPRRVCVIMIPERDMTWRNVPCVQSPALPFVCMRNPN